MQNALKTKQHLCCTQFELTQKLLQNLNNFKLTPAAKLVLLYLSSCYNPKHGEMFPKQRTIADKIGVSEASVIRAISELHNEGLIISERKYTNRYKYTSKFLTSLGILTKKMQVANSQNEIKETSKMQVPLIEPKKEQINKPIQVEDYKILCDYARRHKAKNIKAYIQALRQSGSDKLILNEHKRMATRYYTGELKRIERLNFEVYKQVPPDYFENVRKKLL